MRILVQKFGGTSVADIDRLKMVRGKVKAALDQGYKVVVVLSAKSGKTNKLLDLSTRWAAEPDLAEVDSLLSTGEQASVALFSMLLKDSVIKARTTAQMTLDNTAWVIVDSDCSVLDKVIPKFDRLNSPYGKADTIEELCKQVGLPAEKVKKLVDEYNEKMKAGKLCEGHALGEHYLRRLYKGNGRGYRGGAVDVNAGPKDGMIRTQQDFEWVQAMLETGYTFNGVTALSKDQLWYGDLIYADRNGDGNYGDDNDMDFNGRTSTPSYNLGVNLGFAWKGLDFNMTWSGAFDYYIIWNALYYNGTQTTNGHGISERVADNHYFFDAENPADARTNLKGAYPRLTFGTPGDNRQASEFYEYKGDYLKLKNVQIGYTLPSRITKKFYVQQLRFFVSGENLLTITDYPGLDPEKGSAIGYPLMRSVTFGAQITF